VTQTPILTGLSDIGQTRSRNEDSIAILRDAGVTVVADGMGGHPSGDMASRVAAATAATFLYDRIGPHLDRSQDVVVQLRSAMAASVLAAHEAIRSEVANDPELNGMGTTVTALVLDEVSHAYAIGNVGDSRAYLVRGRTLTQVTRDDTWVQDRVDAGELTLEQADRHPFGHILTQCVGLEDPPVVRVIDGTTQPGDVFLLCSDGLVGMLDDGKIEHLLIEALSKGATQASIDAAAHALVSAANEAGGFDNITVSLAAVL